MVSIGLDERLVNYVAGLAKEHGVEFSTIIMSILDKPGELKAAAQAHRVSYPIAFSWVIAMQETGRMFDYDYSL